MVRLSGLAQTEPTPTNTSPQDSDAMFGHLSISDDGLLLVGYPMWDLRAKVEISPEGRTKRAQLLQRVGALPAGPARNDVFVNVQAALAHIPDQFASYAIDVGFCFFGLPDWTAKQAEIDRVVDEFFDPADIKANPAIALVATQLKAAPRWICLSSTCARTSTQSNLGETARSSSRSSRATKRFARWWSGATIPL